MAGPLGLRHFFLAEFKDSHPGESPFGELISLLKRLWCCRKSRFSPSSNAGNTGGWVRPSSRWAFGGVPQVISG